MKFCGFNFFSEINKEGDEKVTEFQEIPNSSTSIASGAYFQVQIKSENKVEINSCLNAHTKEITLEHKIKDLTIYNETCYFLLYNNKITNFNFKNEIIQEISVPLEIFEHISSTSDTLYGYTKHKVFELHPNPKLLFEFSSHQKIAKVSSGIEHTAILTNNGDLYTFGCGLRGQLAQGNISSCAIPTLVEALAGIKIQDVACGGFHTITVSSFGDVYAAGWNSNGQLGIKKATSNLNDEHVKCQQVFTIPELIEFDEEEDIKQVFCGNKHTILKSSTGKLFSAGSNNYGQLGLGNNVEVDKFTEIPYESKENIKVICGYATTYLFE